MTTFTGPVLLLSLLATGQTSVSEPTPTPPVPSRSVTGYFEPSRNRESSTEEMERMSEDIEIFRLLLRRRLSAYYGLPDMVPHSVHPQQVHELPNVEGVYVVNQGIIFTATIPAQPQKSAAVGIPEEKPLTSWERIRLEMRGEKAPPEPKPMPAGIEDVVATLLAENGKNFRQLGTNERLTVGLVARRGGDCALCHQTNTFDSFTGLKAIEPSLKLERGFTQGASQRKPQPNPDTTRDLEERIKQLNDFAGKIATKDPASEEIERLILLADLHGRQGKVSEALSTYAQAYQQSCSEADRQRWNEGKATRGEAPKMLAVLKIMGRIASLRLAGDGMSQIAAATAFREAAQLAAQLERLNAPPATTASSEATPLLSRWVISASKVTCDQFGAGKLTAAEFRHQVTVEHFVTYK